jgi:glycerol-1-phosphate dehydrogenase [NAD(P)+]
VVLLATSDQEIESVEVPRHIVYGDQAVNKLPEVCKRLGIQSIVVVSGPSATGKIAQEKVIPLLEDDFDLEFVTLDQVDYQVLENLTNACKPESGRRSAVIAVGGGRTFDPVKVATCWANTHYLSVPTSSAHDGFASPYINFKLRLMISEDQEENVPPYNSHSPLGIIGDVEIIKNQPRRMLLSGFGDCLAKFVALKDWELAHRIHGDLYDPYSASYALMSAKMVEQNIETIQNANEKGHTTVLKALGGSGVAMSIAGSSRPASGSEHLISHSLDLLTLKHDIKCDATHGEQVGVASILCMFLHGGDHWEKILKSLEVVNAPISFTDLGFDSELVLEAVLMAHTIRPRYTILGTGLTKTAAQNAIDITGVCQ